MEGENSRQKENRNFEPGSKVRVKRSSGEIEEGWKVVRDPSVELEEPPLGGDSIGVLKPEEGVPQDKWIWKFVKRSDLMEWNPQI